MIVADKSDNYIRLTLGKQKGEAADIPRSFLMATRPPTHKVRHRHILGLIMQTHSDLESLLPNIWQGMLLRREITSI